MSYNTIFNWSNISDSQSISFPPHQMSPLQSLLLFYSGVRAGFLDLPQAITIGLLFTIFLSGLLFPPSYFILFLDLFPHFTGAQPPVVSLLRRHVRNSEIYWILLDWKYLYSEAQWYGRAKKTRLITHFFFSEFGKAPLSSSFQCYIPISGCHLFFPLWKLPGISFYSL